jgi:hypothetical protein
MPAPFQGFWGMGTTYLALKRQALRLGPFGAENQEPWKRSTLLPDMEVGEDAADRGCGDSSQEL